MTTTYALRFYKPDFLLKKLWGRISYPKQSDRNYPYQIEIFDRVLRSRFESGEFAHNLTLFLTSSSDKSYNFSEVESVINESKDNLSDIVAKELFDLLDKHPLVNKKQYILSLKKNSISVKLR